MLSCGSQCSSWVYPSGYTASANRLIYAPDKEGDRIALFGRVGYKKGANGLPSVNLPPQGTITIDNGVAPLAAAFQADPPLMGNGDGICTPGLHDHGTAIQQAIDYLKNQPAIDGVRGRVYLSRGHYAIWNRLVIPDGVVLRGVSMYWNGSTPPSTLHACGSSTTALITIDAPDNASGPNPIYDIKDELVPSGSNSVRLAQGHTVGAGSNVTITRQSPKSWLDDVYMSNICNNCSSCNDSTAHCTEDQTTCCDFGWDPDTKNLVSERVVTRVEPIAGSTDSRIFLDQPLTNALEGKYGPHKLQVFALPTVRARNAAVYKLRGVSHQGPPACGGDEAGPDCSSGPNPTSCDDEDKAICQSGTPSCRNDADLDPVCNHSEAMVRVQLAEDIWINEIIAEGFAKNALLLSSESRYTTAENVTYSNPVGIIKGGWRYPFHNGGQMNLISNCHAFEGRHDFVPDHQSAGPNVFLECTAENTCQDSGPHHRWATGTLFDNLTLTSVSPPDGTGPCGDTGFINVRNRYDSGTGHGWTGSSMVTWNTSALGYRYFNPPTGQNWLLGSTGPLSTPSSSLHESTAHFDFYDSGEHGSRIKPDSLYRSAVAEAYPSTGTLEYRHYFVGDADEFGEASGGDTTDPVNDTVFVNTTFRSWVTSATGLATTGGLDTNNSTERNIPFTFRYDLASNETIVHAYLGMYMERWGAYQQDSWHLIHLGGVGQTAADFSDTVTYYRGCSGVPAPCQTVPADMGGPIGWNYSTTPKVQVLDLAQQLTLLNQKQTIGGRSVGELNVNLYKRTRIDWASLSIVVRK